MPRAAGAGDHCGYAAAVGRRAEDPWTPPDRPVRGPLDRGQQPRRSRRVPRLVRIRRPALSRSKRGITAPPPPTATPTTSIACIGRFFLGFRRGAQFFGPCQRNHQLVGHHGLGLHILGSRRRRRDGSGSGNRLLGRGNAGDGLGAGRFGGEFRLAAPSGPIAPRPSAKERPR